MKFRVFLDLERELHKLTNKSLFIKYPTQMNNMIYVPSLCKILGQTNEYQKIKGNTKFSRKISDKSMKFCVFLGFQ